MGLPLQRVRASPISAISFRFSTLEIFKSNWAYLCLHTGSKSGCYQHNKVLNILVFECGAGFAQLVDPRAWLEQLLSTFLCLAAEWPSCAARRPCCWACKPGRPPCLTSAAVKPLARLAQLKDHLAEIMQLLDHLAGIMQLLDHLAGLVQLVVVVG